MGELFGNKMNENKNAKAQAILDRKEILSQTKKAGKEKLDALEPIRTNESGRAELVVEESKELLTGKPVENNDEKDNEYHTEPVISVSVVEPVHNAEATAERNVLQLSDKTEDKWVEQINKALRIKKPTGVFTKALPKEGFNMNTSPFFVAFFKHLSNKMNRGVDESQKMGFSTVTYQIIAKILIDSGEMEKLAEGDEVLTQLYQSFKNDL